VVLYYQTLNILQNECAYHMNHGRIRTNPKITTLTDIFGQYIFKKDNKYEDTYLLWKYSNKMFVEFYMKIAFWTNPFSVYLNLLVLGCNNCTGFSKTCCKQQGKARNWSLKSHWYTSITTARAVFCIQQEILYPICTFHCIQHIQVTYHAVVIF